MIATSDLRYHVGGDPIGSEGCKGDQRRVFEVGRGFLLDWKKVLVHRKGFLMHQKGFLMQSEEVK